MGDEIKVTKESVGESINLYPESSDESVDFQVKRKIKKPKRKSRACNIQSSDSDTEVPTQRRVTPKQQSSRNKSSLNDDMFEMFTNPDKKLDEQSVDEESYAEEPEEHEEHQPDEMDNEDVEEDAPSPGYNSIDEEKQDLLYKFYRLQTKGVPLPHKFNMHSSIHEMRREFERIKRDGEVNASIKFSRRMLMACVTGIEFMNKRYDPFDIKLEGWSESVMENVEDYDNVFERLHDKYKTKVQMAPEIELLLSLAGSAFMFHLTNSMFNSLPNFKDIAKQNPDIINNLMKSMGTAAAATQQQYQNHQASSPVVNEQANSSTGARAMNPPMFDISSLMGMMKPPQPEMPIMQSFKPVSNETFTNPVSSRTTDIQQTAVVPLQQPPVAFIEQDSVSEVSSISVTSEDLNNVLTKTISLSETSTKSGRRRNRKLNSTPENTISI